MFLRTRCAAACLVATMLSGCALTDDFDRRATSYNYYASDAKSATVLLNIVRAAHAQPLQFSDVTTMSGTSSASASLSSNIPVAISPATATKTTTLSPSASLSGSTTFNVTNLNNQEFYYGLQSPISVQLVANYLKAGINPHILLPLLVSELEVRNDQSISRLTNTADSTASFAAFYTAMKQLVAHGLSAEQVRKKSTIGPVLSSMQARNPRLLAALATNTSSDAPSLSELKGNRGFQLEKSSSSYRFCFDRLKLDGATPFAPIPFETAVIKSGPPRRVTIALAYAHDVPLQALTLYVDSRRFCGSDVASTSGAGQAKHDAGMNFTLTTRSVEGVIQYLGEMVRTELGIGDRRASTLAVPVEPDREFHLFRVTRGIPARPGAWVTYAGHVYGIEVDPSGQRDSSSRVIQLLTDLLALQSSAKNLPAPNIISVIAP